MSEKIINEFFEAEEKANQNNSQRSRKELRNSFFRKEKYNPNNTRRYRDYIDDADLALAHVDALSQKGEFENGQCHCIVLWKNEYIMEVHVDNKINRGESDVRLRKYNNGWREDYKSWCIRRTSWRPVYYKHHSKNTSGMKQMANKHIRHKARIFVRDCDENGYWKEEIAPREHGWYKRAFCSYDICDF